MISAVRPELSSYLGVSTFTEKVGSLRVSCQGGSGKLVLGLVDLGDL